MGREMRVDSVDPEERPGILLVGAPNVGKRTILSRMLSTDFVSDSSYEPSCYGWTIDTKYYAADVSIWMSHLETGTIMDTSPIANHLAALVMVFDMNNMSSFGVLREWVSSGVDIENFDILLCIGNKADLLPGHFAHAEYRRRLQKLGESSSDPHPEFMDYGIRETDGSSLLGEEEDEQSSEIKKSCLEWCGKHGIEYVEACAANADFDRCLSIDGDLQGIERLLGALSAHMWPGMIMKSMKNKLDMHPPIDRDDFSDDSEFEIEYERLSNGSAEPWDHMENSSASFNTPTELSVSRELINEVGSELQVRSLTDEAKVESLTATGGLISKQEEPANREAENSSSKQEETIIKEAEDSNFNQEEPGIMVTDDPLSKQEDSVMRETEDPHYRQEPVIREVENGNSEEIIEGGRDENLEQLMCEISHMRENLRLMPDFQRREMAAKLAMKMAAMFDDGDEDDSD
ncbi:hypothetical protein AMTRI_Chr09g33640 [Amborella trichopoda]|uniref:Uncharacterized protein n=1 Tax=Amborella trichopoda TaxID=13333 RepID=U5D3V4_AMBTC|nr:uncharacterized protein LOC18445447 isoform X2 [Amborella trichopoda]ERN17114.1 hypothetical protein AMTR_s00044p00111360 [Amborella trichopoda]|eukprot:XP_006855647.1 uncharacterized protein LOC18445447 isoform X2 [Amborella trichopoda]